MSGRTIADVVEGVTCILGEAPLWTEPGEVWFSDIDGRELHRVEWSTGAVSSVKTDQSVCCMVSAEGGGQVVAMEGSVAVGHLPDLTSVRDVKIPSSSRFNDGGCDPMGRLFLGTTDREFTDGRGSLIRVDERGEQQVLTGLSISNGLGWTGDGTTMAHIDTLRKAVFLYSYDLDEATPVGDPRVLDVSALPGLPDGCALDVEDRLWIAFWGGSQVVCIDLNGRVCETIPLPVPHVTSCCFAGPAHDSLFITTARPLGDTTVHAGAPFVAELGVIGASLSTCRSV